MNVVFHSTDGMDEDVLVLANAGGVRPKTFFHLRWDEFLPLFCTENNVHYILKIGVRQGVAPPALGILTQLTQRSRAGLTSRRASGASPVLLLPYHRYSAKSGSRTIS
jgi:hypothetical protein